MNSRLAKPIQFLLALLLILGVLVAPTAVPVLADAPTEAPITGQGYDWSEGFHPCSNGYTWSNGASCPRLLNMGGGN